jgi:hypothetical protein
MVPPTECRPHHEHRTSRTCVGAASAAIGPLRSLVDPRQGRRPPLQPSHPRRHRLPRRPPLSSRDDSDEGMAVLCDRVLEETMGWL